MIPRFPWLSATKIRKRGSFSVKRNTIARYHLIVSLRSSNSTESGLMRRMRLPVRFDRVTSSLQHTVYSIQRRYGHKLSFLSLGGLGSDRLRKSRRLDAELVELADILIGQIHLAVPPGDSSSGNGLCHCQPVLPAAR